MMSANSLICQGPAGPLPAKLEVMEILIHICRFQANENRLSRSTRSRNSFPETTLRVTPIARRFCTGAPVINSLELGISLQGMGVYPLEGAVRDMADILNRSSKQNAGNRLLCPVRTINSGQPLNPDKPHNPLIP